MDRGKSEFKTMKEIKTEVDNPNASNITRNFHKSDVQMQGGPGKKVVEHDPMKNIMSKGLVHHMQMPSHIKVKGFTLDGTEVPTNHIGDRQMSRGNAEFEVMKGFELEVKGGETSDTMPPEASQGPADEDKLKDLASKDGPRGKKVTNADDLTIEDNVDLVGSKAKEDIESGYVQDSKESTKKGLANYEEMVTKGLAADIEINPHNINESLSRIDAHVEKGFGSKKKVNCDLEAKCSGKPMKMKGVASTAKKVAIGAGAGALGGAYLGGVTGTLPGAIAAGPGKRLEGAKEGAKATVRPFAHPVKAVKAGLHGLAHPIKVANPDDPHSEYVGGIQGAIAAGRKVRRGTPED